MMIMHCQSFETTFTTDRACSTELKELIIVAPVGANTVLILTGNCCEEMAHLHLFPYW